MDDGSSGYLKQLSKSITSTTTTTNEEGFRKDPEERNSPVALFLIKLRLIYSLKKVSRVHKVVVFTK